MTFVSFDLSAHANVPDAVAAHVLAQIDALLAVCRAEDFPVKDSVQVHAREADVPVAAAEPALPFDAGVDTPVIDQPDAPTE